jgi:DnaJ-domain-containing protein 1
LIKVLEQQILKIVESRPQGISEFALLKKLQAGGFSEFGEELFREDLAMFRAHFLLFHILYGLRQTLHEHKRGYLKIHVVNIRLLESQQTEADAEAAELAEVDALADYYLNIDNLTDTTLDDVQQLLGDFWGSYFASEKRDEALQVLGLKVESSQDEIEKRYRQLAMLYHPDRGGSNEQFIRLQEAKDILRRCG